MVEAAIIIIKLKAVFMVDNDQVKNLSDNKAVAKLKELVKHNSICLFTTNLNSHPLRTRPMSTKEVDDEGNLWFLSSRSSHKNIDIDDDPNVQLFFSNNSDYEFLSVYGEAAIYTNRDKIEELWSPIVKAWFKEGKDDPDLTAIKVTPRDAYYWDTKNNKLVSIMKIMASVVSGTSMDDGIEGELHP
jgi:general stress protein 26